MQCFQSRRPLPSGGPGLSCTMEGSIGTSYRYGKFIYFIVSIVRHEDRKKKGAPDRQNRCALTVAAEAASPPPQQGDQCLTPINVPFGEEDITPFTGEFLAPDLGQTLGYASGLTLKGPGWGRKMGPESTARPFRPGASALRQVRPTRFSITRASARNRMDGMLTASQGGHVLMRPRLEKRPFMM